MEKIFFIESKEQYLSAIESWKKFINENRFSAPSASQLIFYNIIRSKPWSKGFSPVTKKTKLDNGCDKWYGLKKAIDEFWLSYRYYNSIDLLKPFGKTINKENVGRAWAIIEQEKARLK